MYHAMSNSGSFKIDAEDELLLCLARTSRDDETVDRIRSLLGRHIDWLDLMQRAAHHRVLPLLSQSVQRDFSHLVPANILQALQHHYGYTGRRNLFLIVELRKLMQLLDEHRIFAITYKGPIAALLAYHNLCLRQFGDLDILVDPHDYQRARDLLLASGYRLDVDYGWESSLVDDKRRVCIDLHREITPEIFPVHLVFENLRKRLEPLTIAEYKINTLCAKDMLMVHCIQLAKDGWGVNALRLSKVCDIAELLRCNQGMDWTQVLWEAGRLGCRRMIFLSLTVAHELLDAPVSASVLSRARDEAQLSILTKHIYQRLFQYQGESNSVRLSSSREDFYFSLQNAHDTY
jgi:hypothetical protein